MRFSENLNLPILQDGDKYSKEIQNEAFNTIDRECTSIKNTIKSALDISEDVSNAIKTIGDISEELSDLKEKQNEDYYELLESNNYIGDKIRDINSQLDNIVQEVRKRDFKPKLWHTLYIRNNSSDNYKTSRDKELIKSHFLQIKDYGIESLFLPIHIGYDSTSNNLYYQTNFDTLDYVFELSASYNLPIIGMKCHQDYTISDINSMGVENFKTKMKYMFSELIDRYGRNIVYFGVFNEWEYFYKKDGFSLNEVKQNFVPFTLECIELVQSKGLKCGVSVAGASPVGWSSWFKLDNEVLEKSDVVMINSYPPVGNKINLKYTLEDTKNAWNLTALNNVVDEVYSKYGLDKKIIVTETGTPDSFKSYYSPANTNLTNPSIPEENGKAVSLYINGLFESNIKNSEVIEGLVIWFSIFNGGEETKKLIYKYIRGEV